MIERYFLLGNLWLMLALTLALGRRVVRVEPLRVAFLGGIADGLNPGTYSLFVWLAIALGLLCICLSLKVAFTRNVPEDKPLSPSPKTNTDDDKENPAPNDGAK